jgi:PKD repeat protein
VNFQGTGTVRESARPATYSWTFPGGLPATSTAQDPGLVLFGTLGVVTVTFTVTDNNGLVSAPATRTITVTPPPAPPVASIDVPAIDVSIFRNGAVSFQGSGTSVTNLSLTYRWTFAGGSPASSTSQNPGSVRFSSVGPHLVTLVVTDSGGRASEPVTRVITVVASDQADPRITSCGRDNDDD